MDFTRGLFGDNQCSANPIAKTLDSLLTGGKPVDQHFGEEFEDAFEDAWDHAEMQEPNFEEMWDHAHFQMKQEHNPELMRESTHSILQALEAQNDPKFTSSEFYSFIKKLHTGQARIEGTEIVEDWENLWERKPLYEEVWKTLTPEEEEKFEAEWNNIPNDDVDEAMRLWSQAWEEARETPKYNFQDFNPYLELPNPFEVGMYKLETYENTEAVLCFEAELHKNPENSEAWAILGELHLANDDDDKAIEANLRGLENDPYNLEILSNLGISYTNNFDDENSVKYLSTWLQNHPDYSHILTDDIIQAFLNASQINPNDYNIWKALGVLHFKENELDQAEEFFRQATFVRPGDPTLWNSLGSCLSKKANYDESLQCYYKALELKPNYVRAWANIGLTLWNMGDAHKAARFYLCALSLNPEAEHIYNLLETAFKSLERPDLVEKLQARDPLAFADEFHVITRGELPKQY